MNVAEDNFPNSCK